MNVLFIDRDGTIIDEPPDGKVDSLEKFKLKPFVLNSLKTLQDHGYILVMVTNQPTLGTESFSYASFEVPHNKLMKLFKKEGIQFREVFICPHTLEDNCSCRKPKTGLVDEFLKNNTIDKDRSYVVGDRITDVELAENIGCKSIHVSSKKISNATYMAEDWKEITKYILKGS
ncbi:histidinol-phosphatase [Candidatus Roizmanbacteria bacterium]|nr:histidinol-phosphatase [Candidatus Roizmanbacteria bacterium]